MSRPNRCALVAVILALIAVFLLGFQDTVQLRYGLAFLAGAVAALAVAPLTA